MNPAGLEAGVKKSRMQGVEGMDVRSMGRSKKNLRRISETVTAYNLQRLADILDGMEKEWTHEK